MLLVAKVDIWIQLPGPDFNKQVYEFEAMKQIWNQANYNERLKIEAEIMVTLEALKTSIRYNLEDVFEIKKFLKSQYLGIKPSVLHGDMAAN